MESPAVIIVTRVADHGATAQGRRPERRGLPGGRSHFEAQAGNEQKCRPLPTLSAFPFSAWEPRARSLSCSISGWPFSVRSPSLLPPPNAPQQPPVSRSAYRSRGRRHRSRQLNLNRKRQLIPARIFKSKSQAPAASSQQPAAMPILPPRFPSWKFGGISLQGRAKTRRVRHFRDWPPHQKQKPKRMGRTGLAGHRMETDGVYGRLLNARLLRVEPPSAPSPASRSEVGG